MPEIQTYTFLWRHISILSNLVIELQSIECWFMFKSTFSHIMCVLVIFLFAVTQHYDQKKLMGESLFWHMVAEK